MLSEKGENIFRELVRMYDSIEEYLPVIFPTFVDVHDADRLNQLVHDMSIEELLNKKQCYEALSTNAKHVLHTLYINRSTKTTKELQNIRINGNTIKGQRLDKLLSAARVEAFLKRRYEPPEAEHIYQELSSYFSNL